MMLRLYRGLTTTIGPALPIYLAGRKRRGKEDPVRMPERMGRYTHPRPAGKLIWVHGASVGEALSVLPLIEKLASRQTVLLTTGTVTSARMMAGRLPANAIHQFVPVDRAPWVRRFLDHWKPDLALWLESELWPNLIAETGSRGIPMALINGRVSDRSFSNWRRFSNLATRLLGAFDLCLGQTEEDSQRLHALGARRVATPGNLKFAAPPLPVDAEDLRRLEALHLHRPSWIAASTHAGEEMMAGRAHLALKSRHPDLLTLIAPRHPERGDDIAQDLREMGLVVAQRSKNEEVTPKTDIHLADTIGEMGLFYRLAPIAFMGKSILAAGGQNPIEPAKLGVAVLMGPRMDNFRDVAHRLLVVGAAREVADETGLIREVSHLLDHEIERRGLADAALSFAANEAGVLNRILAALAPLLDRMHAHP
ncbi:MAG: 3-deoxy-D-manno-octulosonic acid transferase [Rhodospirillales bacterium]|jgi:3-deoxy-D-manno-octulosonic-acid transferase|nr:3-deoxy-D-manno-octulosonic acid transferase [Rhodospirillales bacterium]